MIFLIKLPETTAYIIERIEKNGFEAFAVGGCIRDSLLGRVPNDWDITTSAKPADIMNIFENTVETGIEHGTVTVVIDKEPYEVTTYRIDGDYTDGRHPDSVEFTENIEEDLSRRDFTINAMAYNNSTGLVDVFGGREDLENRVIRCVGNPKKRFEEDALRMMRGIRFSAQLGFSIEKDTFKAIEEMADSISVVSIERINVEFTKTLMSDAKKIMIYHETGILKNVLPELYTVEKENLKGDFSIEKSIKMGIDCANLCKKDLACRLAGFFVYINEAIGVENTKKILKKMRYDNKTISKTCELLKYSMRNISNNKEDLKYLLMKLDSVELLEDLIDLKAAEVDTYLETQKKIFEDESTKNDESDKVGLEVLEAFTVESLIVLNNIENTLKEIVDNKECFRVKDLDINGKDLIAAGVKPGKEIGEMLNKILKEVIKNPDINKKEKLLEIIK
ncbi:CCA tRNA nucleotidyltransferase [Peptacetobacter sp. AB845]|uniref:CCA tRNA nucleotidyltransferase n=1 Tax=Peptacetobacter sp. AB845 TaxID=3388429 RepID=UPI0039C99579